MRRIGFDDNAVAEAVTGNPIFQEAIPPEDGTMMRDYWFNAVQEEICSVIEGAGVTLDGTKKTQLRDAIRNNLWIPSSITINTGASLFGGSSAFYSTLQGALDSLRGRYIAKGATVTILITSVAETLTAPIVIDHPQGSQIIIRGSLSDRTLYKLRINPAAFERDDAAFMVKTGIQIQGLTIESTVSTNDEPFAAVIGLPGSDTRVFYCAFNAIVGTPVLAEAGSRINLINVNLSSLTTGLVEADEIHYGCGMVARNGGYIYADSVTPFSNPYASVLAERGGVIELKSSTFSDSSITATTGGKIHCRSVVNRKNAIYEFLAIEGGFISAVLCTAGGNTAGQFPDVGFFAWKGSKIVVDDCLALHATAGFSAAEGSTIHATNSSANTCTIGWLATDFSAIFADGQTGTGNGTNKVPAANTNDTSTLARMV